MTGPPNKRQKRQEYRDAAQSWQRQQQQNQQSPHNLQVDEVRSTATLATADHDAPAEAGRQRGGPGGGDGVEAALTQSLSENQMPKAKSKKETKQEMKEMKKKGTVELPKKKFYRQRAHANPFSDHGLDDGEAESTTGKPAKMTRQVEIADVGCGFGGLLVALSPVLPEVLMIGMELRVQVLEYVQTRIQALRLQHQEPADNPTSSKNNNSNNTNNNNTNDQPPTSLPSPNYQNISALRTNTMKHLPNFFHRHQLTHLFLCFPDPHFKTRKHKARIVSAQLNAEYAFVVRPGGKVYTITDVEELAGWMERRFEGGEEGRGEVGDGKEEGREEGKEKGMEEGEGGFGGPITWTGVEELWERVSDDELAADPCVRIMMDETEEGKKVTRNGGKKFVAVWRRKADAKWPDET